MRNRGFKIKAFKQVAEARPTRQIMLRGFHGSQVANPVT